MTAQDTRTPRLYNLVSPLTARRLTRTLRSRGYTVTVRQQWVTVVMNILTDEDAVMILRSYGAIAYESEVTP